MLAQPPGLHELEHFLLQRPATQLPICPDVLLWLPPSERHHFCAAFGPLARAFAASVSPSMSVAESEHIMVRDVRWGRGEGFQVGFAVKGVRWGLQ